MFFLTPQLVGIDINATEVRVARIDRRNGAWRLVEGGASSLPQNVLKPSFKNLNIVDEDRFKSAIREAMEGISTKVSTAGLSLPSEIVKTMIQKYPELPDSTADTERLIGWGMERSFHSPIQSAKISYQRLGDDTDGMKRLLITIGMSEVIRQYETLFKQVGIETRVIRPAGINLFNVFAEHFPQEGTVAFMGLFETYFNFMVFDNGELSFFHGVKRGFSDLQFFQDVDMTLKHYLDSNPGKQIRQIRVGSQVGYHQELKEVLNNLIDMEVSILNEGGIILSDYDLSKPLERLELSAFVSAMGAAMSLAH